MKRLLLAVCVALVGVQGLLAQSPPRLVPAAGVARDAGGNLLSGPVTVTFVVYATQEGGEPLWKETQTLTLDAAGRYSTLLGATRPEGLPAELFTQSEARWLAVSIDGQPEGPRMFWASVPYALKAADAETVNGMPIDAFVLNGSYRKPGDTAPVLPKADGDGSPAVNSGVGDPVGEDQVIADDLIVQGSACVGIDCVNNENFGFDTLRLKENNTRLQFNDTSVGTFPSNNWQIRANSSTSGGGNFLGIVDQGDAGESENGTIVFQVEAGARANALYVESDGDVGIGTANPVVTLHAVVGNTPTMRLDQDGSAGFTPQVWDLAGNEANFFVRDVTNGSKLPFRIKPNAPTNSISIAPTGRVGLGKETAVAPLDIKTTATTIGTGNAAARLANPAGDVALQLDASDNGSFWNISMLSGENLAFSKSGTGATEATLDTAGNLSVRGSLKVASPSLAYLQLDSGANGSFWNVTMQSDQSLVFSKSGTGATEASLDTAGNMTLRGNLTVGGNCSDGNGGSGGVDGCDRVFHPDYPMPSIEDHASQMWDNGYLPAVGPTPEDAPWNIGRKAAGMLNELEKAHIYIDQLQRQLKEQQQLFESLKTRLEALERSVRER